MFKYLFSVEGTVLHFCKALWTSFTICRNADHAVAMLNVPYDGDVPVPDCELDTGRGKSEYISMRVARFKYFTNHYGITPAAFKKVFNYHMTNMWPIPEWAKFSVFTQKGSKREISEAHVHLYFQAEPLILQAHDDGLDNLIPLIMLHQIDPYDLKQLFGKAAWKRLSHNSKARNALIAQKTTTRHTGAELSLIPTTVLKVFNDVTFVPAIRAMMEFEPRFKNVVNMVQDSNMYNIIDDTIRMAGDLDVQHALKHAHTRNQWLALHNKLAKILHAQQYTETPYPHLKSHVYKEESYDVILLTSPYEIWHEGEVMHHCVSSYIDAVKHNRYRVYSVYKNAEKYATLGVRIGPSDMNTRQLQPTFAVDQCYGPCNTQVDMTGFDFNMFIRSIYENLEV
jgi:hypothetical protein